MIKSILSPGYTLFEKAFTYQVETIPATPFREATQVVHPKTVSRVFLLTAMPLSGVDLIVKTVAFSVYGILNTLTLNYLDANFNRYFVNTYMSYVRAHVRTVVLLVNPKQIDYSLRDFDAIYNGGLGAVEIRTSINIEKVKLYSHYFQEKVNRNHDQYRAAKTGLWSRVKSNFEVRVCARINYLGMTLIAAGESLRHGASLSYNLYKEVRSLKSDPVPYNLLSNQYRLIVSLERIWEGLFGFVFNAT
jgi:hypothetical protein